MDLGPALAGAHRGAILPFARRGRPWEYVGGNRCDVGSNLRFGGGDRGGQAGAVACHGAFDCLAEVVPDVPSIGDLHRVRCSRGGAFGVGAGAIAADDLHARVGP